jgi:hypothetical protein
MPRQPALLSHAAVKSPGALSGDEVSIEPEILPRVAAVTRSFVDAFALPAEVQGLGAPAAAPSA